MSSVTGDSEVYLGLGLTGNQHEPNRKPLSLSTYTIYIYTHKNASRPAASTGVFGVNEKTLPNKQPVGGYWQSLVHSLAPILYRGFLSVTFRSLP